TEELNCATEEFRCATEKLNCATEEFRCASEKLNCATEKLRLRSENRKRHLHGSSGGAAVSAGRVGSGGLLGPLRGSCRRPALPTPLSIRLSVARMPGRGGPSPAPPPPGKPAAHGPWQEAPHHPRGVIVFGRAPPRG